MNSEYELQGLEELARILMVAVRTAPKSRGIDRIKSRIIKEGVKQEVVEEMENLAAANDFSAFQRDAENLASVPLAILVGVKDEKMGLAGCSFCGYEDCQENEKNDGICLVNFMDLGIAIGSAVSKAADFRIDNRIMFTIGRAAANLELLGSEITVVHGIPLSVTGKNIFYDR